MASRLRVVRIAPRRAGETWELWQAGTRMTLGYARSETEAVDQALALLHEGGTVEVLNEEEFLISRWTVPDPPEPPRTILMSFVVRLVFASAYGGLLSWVFHSPVPASVALSSALLNSVSQIRRSRAARRALATAESRSPHHKNPPLIR